MARTASRPAPLDGVLDALEARYGRPTSPPGKTPFEHVLYDTASYLVPDPRRREVHERLAKEIGVTPEAILAAQPGRLVAAARRRLKEAVKTFARFGGIGVPGAERIVLFEGAHAVPAPESNGLRVLRRRHGRETCRNAEPVCAACAVRSSCPWPDEEVRRRAPSPRRRPGSAGPR